MFHLWIPREIHSSASRKCIRIFGWKKLVCFLVVVFWGFFTAVSSLGPVFYWFIHGLLHWKGKEIIAGSCFKWNIKCAVTLLLPNSPHFSHYQISPWLEKQVTSEVSFHHTAARMFVWFTVFNTCLFFFLWNMLTLYLGTVASLEIDIKSQHFSHQFHSQHWDLRENLLLPSGISSRMFCICIKFLRFSVLKRRN